MNQQNILNALQREMHIIPICIDMESSGVRLSPMVNDDYRKYSAMFAKYDQLLLKVCNGAEPGKKQWFNIARQKGIIDESKIVYTPKGNPRYGREFLEGMIADKEIKEALSKRSRLQKAVSTYLLPYKTSYNLHNGRFYPWFSQTRGDDDYGTSTGRFSSNFQQIPRDSPDPDMPNIRSYILPDEGDVLIKRDFSGQELRVAAHYAEGGIAQAYRDNPKLDVHTFVRDEIFKQTGLWLENTGEDRVIVKSISFLKLYGGGAGLLASRMGFPLERGQFFFKAYDQAIPEFKALNNDIMSISKSGKPIRTWGGRPYMVQAPTINAFGRKQEYYYKLLNILIQGSSADMTKEAMIRYYYHPDRKGRLMMTVHDELIVSVHPNYVKQEMALLRWAMDEIPGWDIPLVSEGKIGHNLSDMEEYVD